MRMRFGWPTMILLGAVGGLLAVGGVLYTRNSGRTNKVALAQTAKRVTTAAAVAQPFQPTRRYVGTVEPWVQAKIGPQLVSAYVSTVLVRPGAAVKQNEVIATLDCRDASAMSRQVEAQAKAVDAMSNAAATEAGRVSQLLDGKYVSENEVDQKKADAASKQAQVASLKAQMMRTSLEVNDCVLRSPFDGEVADRHVDPGAFVRPGSSIATIVDRHLLRITADVPEDDFESVTVETPVSIHLLATKRDLVAKISRRAPSADPATRTAHIELDIDDPKRTIPAWTTAELSLDVGSPVPGTAIPLAAASVRGTKATVFVAKDGIAHQVTAKTLGEAGGTLYLDPAALAPGTAIVTEGRTVLSDGDAIAATADRWAPDQAVKK
jgi:membrane fusion protein, multidrug efflux system